MAAKRKPPVRALSRRKARAVVRIVGPGSVLDGGTVLPGFQVTVDDIFAQMQI